MKPIKVTNAQKVGDKIYCPAKWVFIYGRENLKHIFVPSLSGKLMLSPILISETESSKNCVEEDWICNGANIAQINCLTVDDPNKGLHSKVLALPENIPTETIKEISEGKIKEGDECFIECEETTFPNSEGVKNCYEGYQIKLTDNKVTLINPDFICCQREYEEEEKCKIQCEHCKVYYAPLEQQRKEELLNVPKRTAIYSKEEIIKLLEQVIKDNVGEEISLEKWIKTNLK